MTNKVNPIQVQKYLKGIDYPASKNDLIKCAEEHGADDNIRSTLEQLSDKKKFETSADVSKAIGEIE